MPKLYINEFVGISNRLEALPLAFAIRQAYGHDIVLDWRELDSFSVSDTRRGKLHLLAKLGTLRLRDCDEAAFASLKGKKILLRSLDGPAKRLDAIYLEVAGKIQLESSLVRQVKETFATWAGRPVVGVHVRHGDFANACQSRYQVSGVPWPAVPIWWYEHAMAAVAAKQKDVCFFLASTGDPALHSALHRNFDVFSLGIESRYGYKGPDHGSKVNPVADLFALACCPVMLATPISGYSHWAANALGGPTTCIVPLPEATSDQPLMGVLRLYGKRLPVWRNAGRSGEAQRLNDRLESVDLSQGAATKWL
jgi:hypothetical protein